MKKLKLYLLTSVMLSALLVSCEEETVYDETFLYGKWKSGTEYYRYFNDGTGYTWDTSDDVTEEEAQDFTWTLEASDLTQIHIIEMGGTVPKYYTVTELTSTTLKYKDDFGKSFSFSKVSD
ncbi:MAG: lipocalin family protein [Breznakibacter sp.]